MVKKGDLLRFKKLLMAEKERLIERSKKVISEEIMKQSAEPADEADISSSTIGQSLTIRLLSREAALVNKIEKALNKIEGGSFGICESCDDAIDLKRLKVRPVAELCIKCKEESEKREVNAYFHSENEIIWSYSWFNGDED